MVAFGDVKGEGVRFTGLATQWAALNCLAEGLDSPEEGRVRLEADHRGATTGVVYPSLARFFCLRYAVRGRGEGLSGFVCAAAEVLYSHQPSTFSADGIGGVRSDGRLRDVCFGLRTVASAEQPNRREATSSFRWVLFEFSSELFLRAFVTICDRLDLTLVPGHDLRAGAHRGQRRVCFLCATRYLVALKRDLFISHYLLQSDRCSSSSSFQLTRRLRWRFIVVFAGRVVIF